MKLIKKKKISSFDKVVLSFLLIDFVLSSGSNAVVSDLQNIQ